MKKRLAALFLSALLLLSLSACGVSETTSGDGEKILRLAVSFAYPSLDAHKEY